MLQSPERERWLLRFVGVVLLVALGACFAIGADRPANPVVLPPGATAGLAGHSSRTSRVSGFGQIGFRVVDGSAVSSLRCALLADTAAAQHKGMMGRSDLAGYDAMVFRFQTDVDTAFYNKDVPIPLSVAWFDSAGVLVSTHDLEVCSAVCPTVAPPVEYRNAIEVPRGGLAHLGITHGSALFLGGSCH